MLLARALPAAKIPASPCKGYFFTAPNCQGASSSGSGGLAGTRARMSSTSRQSTLLAREEMLSRACDAETCAARAMDTISSTLARFHDRNAFDCGSEPLNLFLKQTARTFPENAESVRYSPQSLGAAGRTSRAPGGGGRFLWPGRGIGRFGRRLLCLVGVPGGHIPPWSCARGR